MKKLTSLALALSLSSGMIFSGGISVSAQKIGTVTTWNGDVLENLLSNHVVVKTYCNSAEDEKNKEIYRTFSEMDYEKPTKEPSLKPINIYSTTGRVVVETEQEADETINRVINYVEEKYPSVKCTARVIVFPVGDYEYRDGAVVCSFIYEYPDNMHKHDIVSYLQDLYDSFGIQCNWINYGVPIYGSIMGDADKSGDINIMDAVNVMAYSVNPYKYPLSDLGKQLSDVYNTADGVNNMDALEIMKYLANVA